MEPTCRVVIGQQCRGHIEGSGGVEAQLPHELHVLGDDGLRDVNRRWAG